MRAVHLPVSAATGQLALSEKIRAATVADRTARCGRCGRLLRARLSVDGELGPVCRRKRAEEARR